MDTREKNLHTSDDLCGKYQGRGLARLSATDAEKQKRSEAETAKNAPHAYRYSDMDDREKNRFRSARVDGERQMTPDDLIRYSRVSHGDAKTDNTENEDKLTRWDGNGLVSGEAQKQKLLPFSFSKKGKSEKKTGSAESTATAPSRVETFLVKWFPKDGTQYVHDPKRRRFPSTYLAALFVVIISMTLLVGSALILNREERSVLALGEELNAMEKTEEALEADLSVKNDLYAIRKTAIGEYGMVDGYYVDMKFIALSGEEQIVAYEEKEEKKIGLAALLSGFFGANN